MLPHRGHLFQVLRTGTISRKPLSVVHQAEYLNRRLVVSLLVVTTTVIVAALAQEDLPIAMSNPHQVREFAPQVGQYR